jgi:mannosylglycerate hydrolase
MSPPSARTVIVVAHSHWDREWYATQEQFRFGLVELLDEVVEALEADDGLPAFLLDGQTILVEDYLEIRPERRERLRRLVAGGRLAIGPWYVQPDVLLVSGESLVRNLLRGVRVAEELGGVSRHGWLPDAFGHPAQLPQLLRGFGIETFFFMRGLEPAVEDLGSEFWWRAPDGSRVLAHYMSESYSNAAVLASRAEEVRLRYRMVGYDGLDELLGRLASRSPSGVLLLLNGSDHTRLQPGIARDVAALDAGVAETVRLGSLDDFVAAVRERAPELREYAGELVAGRHFTVLRGTASTRGELKRRNDAVERLLEGHAERFAALALALGLGDDRAFLAHAWRHALLNSPHDSICGCSIDPVHDEMASRWAIAEQVAGGVVRRALDRLAAHVAPPADDGQVPIVVVNPSPWARRGRVEIAVAPYRHVPLGRRLFGAEGEPREPIDLSAARVLDADGRAVPFTVRARHLAVEDALDRRKQFERVTLALDVDEVPPLGFTTLRLVAGEAAPSAPARTATRRGERSLENTWLRVTVAPDGTLEIDDKRSGAVHRGLHRLLDQGDAGDEYTFGPVGEEVAPDADWRVEPGGDADALRLTGEVTLPAELGEDRRRRSAATVACPVEVEVRLPAEAARVELATVLDNRARDHRLRAAFPLGFAAAEATAEAPFGVQPRPAELPAGAGWAEPPTGTQTQGRFVVAAAPERGLALLNQGLREYELADGRELRLTLLRGVGWLSRGDIPARPTHAGPALPTPGAQGLGRHELRYAVVPLTGPPQPGVLQREAEEFGIPLAAAAVQGASAGRDGRGAVGSLLALDHPALVLSALKPAEAGPAIVLRVVNASDSPQTGRLTLGLPVAAAHRAGMDERPAQPLALDDDELVLEVPPWRIETVRLELRS